MLFNSIEFAIFLPIIFFLYWFVANKNLKLQSPQSKYIWDTDAYFAQIWDKTASENNLDIFSGYYL